MTVVSFPGLGLSFSLSRVAFAPFGLPVYWYGLIIACGFLLAVLMCTRWAGRFGITSDQVFDMLFFAVPAAVVGLRLYYVVFNLGLYRRADGSLDVLAMLNIRDGGLAIYGGILAAALTLYLFCRARRIRFLAFADLGVHGLFIGQMVGRWGNFTNVEAYGGLTDLPWRMCAESIAAELYYKGLADTRQYQAVLEGVLGVHPTFFYESAWNFIGLILIYLMGRYARRFDGQLFLSYVLWYGLGRFWIEGLRTDSLYFFGLKLMGQPLRVSQVLALCSALAAGAILVSLLRRPHRPEELYVNQLAAEHPAAPIPEKKDEED